MDDKCSTCGEAFKPAGCSPGYGAAADGSRHCLACCNAREAAEFAAAETYTAYVSCDGRTIQTWPGGTLARVTSRSTHRAGFGGTYDTLRCVAADGSRWHGRGPGCGMYVRLRRSKA